MVGHSSKNLEHEEMGQDMSPHKVAFPESGLNSWPKQGMLQESSMSLSG